MMPTKPIKPIRVFYSDLTGRFFATRSYKDMGNGVMKCTGQKFDVTNDIASVIVERGLEFQTQPKAEKEPTP